MAKLHDSSWHVCDYPGGVARTSEREHWRSSQCLREQWNKQRAQKKLDISDDTVHFTRKQLLLMRVSSGVGASLLP